MKGSGCGLYRPGMLCEFRSVCNWWVPVALLMVSIPNLMVNFIKQILINCNFFLCWYLLMCLGQFKNMAAEPSVCHQETFLVQVGHTDPALVHRAWPEGSIVFQEQAIPRGRRVSTNQNAELWNPAPVNTYAKTFPKLKLREHFRRRGRKIVKASSQRCCEFLSPRNVRPGNVSHVVNMTA